MRSPITRSRICAVRRSSWRQSLAPHPPTSASFRRRLNSSRPERAAKKARQGVAYHALEELAVMDPETMQRVPWDGETMGEVMFRGNIVMKGYLKNKKAT